MRSPREVDILAEIVAIRFYTRDHEEERVLRSRLTTGQGYRENLSNDGITK